MKRPLFQLYLTCCWFEDGAVQSMTQSCPARLGSRRDTVLVSLPPWRGLLRPFRGFLVRHIAMQVRATRQISGTVVLNDSECGLPGPRIDVAWRLDDSLAAQIDACSCDDPGYRGAMNDPVKRRRL